MITLPIWAVYAVSFGSPLAAFLAVLITNLVTRRADRERESRSRREETWRTLRWAAEQSVSHSADNRRLGLLELQKMDTSDAFDVEQQNFIDAALAAIIEPSVEEYLGLQGDIDVLEIADQPPASADRTGDGSAT